MTASPPIQLLEELGRGSTAVVWRAVLSEEFRGLPAGSEVACKRYFPTEAARSCQAREARVGGSVQAEGLIRLYGSGEDSEGPWLLMELLPGRNLEEVLSEEHALPEPLVRSIGKQLSGAQLAHARGGSFVFDAEDVVAFNPLDRNSRTRRAVQNYCSQKTSCDDEAAKENQATRYDGTVSDPGKCCKTCSISGQTFRLDWDTFSNAHSRGKKKNPLPLYQWCGLDSPKVGLLDWPRS